MRFRRRLSLITIALSLCLPVPAEAILKAIYPGADSLYDQQDWSQPVKCVDIPVLFGTDRQQIAGSQNLVYGMREVPVPLKVPVSNLLLSLGWHMNAHPPESLVELRSMKEEKPTQIMNRSSFKTALMKNVGSGDCLIFIHGFNNTFDNAMDRVSELSSFYLIPAVAYSWSADKSSSIVEMKDVYKKSETDVTQSDMPFKDFMKTVLDVIPADRIVLVGHSMGCRLLERYLEDRSLTAECSKQFKEANFCSADVDAATFVKRAQSIVRTSKKVRVICSELDVAMQASRRLHGYTRLGEGKGNVNALPHYGIEVVNVSAAVVNGFDHDMSDWLMSELYHHGKPVKSNDWTLEKDQNGCFVLTPHGETKTKMDDIRTRVKRRIQD